jgi:LysM repeat protein
VRPGPDSWDANEPDGRDVAPPGVPGDDRGGYPAAVMSPDPLPRDDATDPTSAEPASDVRARDAGVAATTATAPPLVPADACPFLIAAAGAYRMSIPDREHRCAAFVPATSLALSKQARLCLTANHPGCATYLASTSARQARVGNGERVERSGRWGLARTMPVVQEVGGLRATLGALIADRRTWPAIPAVLLATLLVALGLSGSWGQTPITAIGSATPAPTTTPTLEVATRPSPVPSPVPSTAPLPTVTPGPSLPPTSVPTPTPRTYITYRVKSGDTLSGIANHFHTTVSAITRLNGITSTTILHVGEILKIPRT